MNLAVLLYQYADNPKGIPAVWPAEVVELGTGTNLPGVNWLLMTSAEYASYLALHQAEYDAWQSANPAQSGEIWKEYSALAESVILSTTTSTTYQQKLRLTTESLSSGTYKIAWTYDWGMTSTNYSFQARVRVDSSTELTSHLEEPKDGTVGQRRQVSSFATILLTSGVHTIDIDYCTSNSAGTARIQNAKLEIWRYS